MSHPISLPTPGGSAATASAPPPPRSSRDLAASLAAPPLPHHTLVVATDGLWEFLSDAQVADIARQATTADEAAEKLLEAAQLAWAARFGGAHCDDITLAVAFVPAA